MSTHGFRWHILRTFCAMLAIVCLLSASYAQDAGNSAPPPTPSTIPTGANLPPIEQALIPEGVFAIQLADALKLGPASDEAKAEGLLSGLGIEPKNGWITEYPVTPNVLGDVEKGVSMACDKGKISMTKDQALKLVGEVKTKLGLQFNLDPTIPVPVGVTAKPGNTTIYSYTDKQGVTHYTDAYDSIPAEYRGNVKVISNSVPPSSSNDAGAVVAGIPDTQYIPVPDPSIIDDYYYDQGPPVVTYYSPPDPYYYLYSWIPYPFWYTGYYIPGYFVLNNFHRNIYFNQQRYYVAHHNGTLSYNNGQNFSPIGRGSSQNQRASSGWFSTSKTQTSAQAIVTLNQNRNGPIIGATASRNVSPRQWFPAAGKPSHMGNAQAITNGQATAFNNPYRPAPYAGGRVFNQPVYNQRAYVPNPPRVYSPPAVAQGRVFNMPRSMGGGFSGAGSFEGFHGGGNSMGHGGGGSRGGGHR